MVQNPTWSPATTSSICSDDLWSGLAFHNACQADHLQTRNRLRQSPMPNWFHCFHFFLLQPNTMLNKDTVSVKWGSASFSIIFRPVLVLDPFHLKPCQLAQSNLKSLCRPSCISNIDINNSDTHIHMQQLHMQGLHQTLILRCMLQICTALHCLQR